MHKLCLVAVDIRSAHNVGSLFRTADGFSAEIILTGISPRPMSEKDERLPHIAIKANKDVSKTALGAEKTVTWRYFSNVIDAIEALKSEGFSIIAIEQNIVSKPISELLISQPTALLLGTEVEGLPQELIDRCDYIYEIPMTGAKESFNVSVSAGIALYQARLN